MKLGHRITYGNREVVNTKKNLFFEQHDPTTILSFLSFYILSQSDPAELIRIILFIFIFLLSYLNSQRFSSLHDEHFKTDEKHSCRIDEPVTL